jgi:hypothetical protein
MISDSQTFPCRDFLPADTLGASGLTWFCRDFKDAGNESPLLTGAFIPLIGPGIKSMNFFAAVVTFCVRGWGWAATTGSDPHRIAIYREIHDA